MSAVRGAQQPAVGAVPKLASKGRRLVQDILRANRSNEGITCTYGQLIAAPEWACLPTDYVCATTPIMPALRTMSGHVCPATM